MGKNLAEFMCFVLHFLLSFVPKLSTDLVTRLKRNKMQFDCLVFLVSLMSIKCPETYVSEGTPKLTSCDQYWLPQKTV